LKGNIRERRNKTAKGAGMRLLMEVVLVCFTMKVVPVLKIMKPLLYLGKQKEDKKEKSQ